MNWKGNSKMVKLSRFSSFSHFQIQDRQAFLRNDANLQLIMVNNEALPILSLNLIIYLTGRKGSCISLAKRSNIVGQTFQICFKTSVWPFGHVAKHCCPTFWSDKVIANALAGTPCGLPKCCKLLKFDKRIVWQAMLERRPNDQALLDKENKAKFVAWCFWQSWRKQKILDEQCFVTWPNGQTFCLTSKFQMLNQRIWSFDSGSRFLFEEGQCTRVFTMM